MRAGIVDHRAIDRDVIDSGAQPAQLVGNQVARAFGLRVEHSRTRHVAARTERVEDSFRYIALRYQIGDQPETRKRRGTGRSHGAELHAGQRARVESQFAQLAPHDVGCGGAGDEQPPILVQRLERPPQRSRIELLDADRRRLDHIGAECGEPRRQLRPLRACAGHHDALAEERPGVEPADGVAERHHGADDGDGGGGDRFGAGNVDESSQSGSHRALPGERSPLHHRRWGVERHPTGRERLDDGWKAAHAHVQHQRAARSRERRPIGAALALRGIFVAGDERD